MAVIISNPESGRRRHLRAQLLDVVRLELESSGFSVAIQETKGAGEASELAREAVAQGADLIVACGGDGTINEVVAGMACSRVPLAVLPGGTANVLARELRLPLDIPAAARCIRTSSPKRISLGRVGDRYFLLMAGIGFDARVVKSVHHRWKKAFGMATYVLEAVRQLWSSPLHRFLVHANGASHPATFACIAKAQFYGPIRMVREADLFSDRFHVYCFPSQAPLRYFTYAAGILANRLRALPEVATFSATRIRCEASADKDVFVQVDGELAGTLPCTIEIVPDALTLMVPNQMDRMPSGCRSDWNLPSR